MPDGGAVIDSRGLGLSAKTVSVMKRVQCSFCTVCDFGQHFFTPSRSALPVSDARAIKPVVCVRVFLAIS